MSAETMYVLISKPSGNLLGEYPTLVQAEAVRDACVALDARNAAALEIVFDDGSDDAPSEGTLSKAS